MELYINQTAPDEPEPETFNGWSNWDTWHAALLIINIESEFNFIMQQVRKTDAAALRSIKANVKKHNREFKKNKQEYYIMDLNRINYNEILNHLKEYL